MKTIKISDELHRHLAKYALMSHKRISQVAEEALREKTKFDSRALAVKYVPRYDGPGMEYRAIEDIIGCGNG